MSFTNKTELLTTVGWKSVLDITTNDKIAQIDSARSIIFSEPVSVIMKDFCGDIIAVENKIGSVYLEITNDHSLVIEKKVLSNPKDKNSRKVLTGNLIKVKAFDARYHQSMTHYTAFPKLNGSINNLSYNDRLLIAFQADGKKKHLSFNPKTEIYTYGFHFSKVRKIERLLHILDSGNFKYSVTHHNKNTTHISVRSPRKLDGTFSWVNLEDMNQEYASEFLDELKMWDGTVYVDKDGWFEYSTIDKSCADVVQAVSSIGGFKSRIVEIEALGNCKKKYRMYVNCNSNIVGGSGIIKTSQSYNNRVFSFKILHNAIVVRVGGIVSVCGSE